MLSRRDFLKNTVVTGAVLAVNAEASAEPPRRRPPDKAMCTVYRAVNGTPEQNLARVVETMGGIGGFIGPDDVVLIKPNVQWWNQGAPNLASLKALAELIMERPGGFRGEVVIAENCHRGPKPWESAGWARPFARNSDIPGVSTFNDLSGLLKKRYGPRFSTVHWIDVSAGAKRVASPSDGPGYVFCDGSRGVPLLKCDNGVDGKGYRETIMTYPVFSTDKGTTVDFRKGVWAKGAYTGLPLRVIVLSALNHHSTYCGMTSSVKNYMGITDLSGGPDPHDGGLLTGNYYNFHSFPFDKWAPGPRAGMLGKAIGSFLRMVRKADLHITTAECVGLSSRTDHPVVRTRAVLASADPAALDFHAAKYLLYPNSRIAVHNPENPAGPLRQYLEQCAAEYGGVMAEDQVAVRSYDLAKGSFQSEGEMAVVGDKLWGSEVKPLLKYFYLRYFG